MAAQELARRGDATFARMVLVSPVVDLSLSNPSIPLVDNPVLGTVSSGRNSMLWAGDLALTDPLASPLYGSRAGLPATRVYAGFLELLAPDVLRLRNKALAECADFSFILWKGEIHDWAGPGSIMPFTAGAAIRPQIRRQLWVPTPESLRVGKSPHIQMRTVLDGYADPFADRHDLFFDRHGNGARLCRRHFGEIRCDIFGTRLTAGLGQPPPGRVSRSGIGDYVAIQMKREPFGFNWCRRPAAMIDLEDESANGPYTRWPAERCCHHRCATAWEPIRDRMTK